MGTVIAIIVVGVVLYYGLYMCELTTIGSKRAVVFIGKIMGKNECRAGFRSCTGKLRRIVTFKETKIYHFDFESSLTNGDMRIEIRTKKRESVAVFNDYNHTADIALKAKERYQMIITFYDASGDFYLNWE